MKLISLLALLGYLVFIQSLDGGHAAQLFQGTAFLGVVGLTFLASVHHLGIRSTLAGFALCLLGRKPSPEDALSVERFRRHAPVWAMYAASILCVLGLIHVMSMLNDPSKIGDGVATAFVAYLYGGLLVLLLGGVEGDVPRASPGPALAPITAIIPGLGLLTVFMSILYAIQDTDVRRSKGAQGVSEQSSSEGSEVTQLYPRLKLERWGQAPELDLI